MEWGRNLFMSGIIMKSTVPFVLGAGLLFCLEVAEELPVTEIYSSPGVKSSFCRLWELDQEPQISWTGIQSLSYAAPSSYSCFTPSFFCSVCWTSSRIKSPWWHSRDRRSSRKGRCGNTGCSYCPIHMGTRASWHRQENGASLPKKQFFSS